MTGNINLACYRKEDWTQFLKMLDDRESMHDSWEEWHKDFLKLKKNLTADGFVVNDFVVDLQELEDYCLARGIKNNGKARSQFASNR